MPIYEYQCNACGHDLEKIQRMSDAPLTDCPDCGAGALRRLVSAPGFRLKGSGWYETDFKRDGKKNLHESHDSTAAAEGKSSPGTDSTTTTDTPKSSAAKAPDTKTAESKPAAAKPGAT
jgi:putative FmdB family regulatory protein